MNKQTAYRASTQAPIIATCRSMQQLCWLKAMDYHMADPQSGYNAGVIICMPLCFVYPCCLCGLPGQLCPHCAESYCSDCGHFCDVPPREYEDSPWGSDAEASPRLGETGGSGEDARKAANYALRAPDVLQNSAFPRRLPRTHFHKLQEYQTLETNNSNE